MSTLLTALPRRGKLSFFGLPLFLLVLCFLFGTNQGFSQQTSTADETQIIQNCVDLPGLQQFFPKNESGEEAKLHVYYYHPLLFSTDLLIKRNDKQVPLKVMSTPIESATNPFFLYSSFVISGNTASTQYDFYYTQDGIQHRVQVKLDLEKADNKWTVIKTDIKN